MEEINYKERVIGKVKKEYNDLLTKNLNEENKQTIINSAFALYFYKEMYLYFTSNKCGLTENEFEVLDSVGEYPLLYMFQDFDNREYESVHSLEGAECFAKSFIEEWDNTLKAVEKNELKTTVNYVKQRVDNEYLAYRQRETMKPKEEIFDNSHQNYVYTELWNYLCLGSGEDELEDIQYRALCEDGRYILPNLYEYYTKKEHAGINTWTDIRELVRGYNQKYHQNIIEGENELG